MTIFMENNSIATSSLPSDYFIRKEVNQYAKKLNFTLAFVQIPYLTIGLFGNILALIIINRKSLRNTSSAVFITYMAIFDSGVLLLHAANLVRPRRNLFLHCSLTYLTDLFTFCANWVLVIITLERCIAVSSPFYAKRFCTVRSARRSVYILVAVAIMIFSSTFPIIYHTNDGSHHKKCLIRRHLTLIHRISQLIVFFGIPDLLLLSNLFTVYVLIRRRKQQTRLSDANQLDMRIYDVHSNRKQRQLTIMLVTVNLSFYLFTTPAVIRFITEEDSPPKDAHAEELKRSFLFSQLSVVLLQLNNATNFIFYCFAGQRFRQAAMDLFHKCSNRLMIFYHRYILCDRNYRLSISSQGRSSQYSSPGRISIPDNNIKKQKNRTSTI